MPNPLPGSADIERYLLGALLRDAQPLPSTLLPSDFLEPRHADIAASMLDAQDNGHPADELTVLEAGTARGLSLDRLYVSALTSEVGYSVLNPAWVVSIAKAAALRRIIATSRKAAEIASDPSADPATVIRFARESLEACGTMPEETTAPDTEIMSGEAMRSFDPANDPDALIGKRWLSKGGSIMLVGQAGTGKSSVLMMWSIALATGRPWFGIAAKRPLKVVILQAENNFGDTAEAYCGALAGAKLIPSERDVLDDNLVICRNDTAVGRAFPTLLEKLIEQHKPDVIAVDPILSFAGIDVSDQEQVTKFLRMDINPILKKSGVILVAMAHTPKPRTSDREGGTPADLAYAMQGSSEFANYFREIGYLMRQPGETPVYKLGFTKRRGRSGLKDLNGDFAGEIYIRHSRTPGVILWEYATPDELAPKDTAETPRKDAAKGSPRRWS